MPIKHIDYEHERYYLRHIDITLERICQMLTKLLEQSGPEGPAVDVSPEPMMEYAGDLIVEEQPKPIKRRARRKKNEN